MKKKNLHSKKSIHIRMLVAFVLSLIAVDSFAQTSTCILGITNPGYVCLNQPATFTNNTQPITCFPCYVWNFPGGSPSSYVGTNPPPVTYASTGSYTVTLYGADAGCVIDDSLNSTSVIIIVQDNVIPLLSINPSPACPDVNIAFNNNSIGDNGNVGAGILFTSWDFGDGNTSSSPFYQPLIFHSYSLPGTYPVTMCVGNSCDTLCITQNLIVDSASARFTYVSTCRINFIGDTTCSNGIISETWDFGDNTPLSTSSNPTHTYAQNGVTYIVVHTIVTNYGTFTSTQAVIQTGGPDATITGFAVNNCGSGVITYSAPCQSGIVYSWSVSGGTSSSPINGCSYDVNWSGLGGYIVLSATDTVNDCTSKDTLRVPTCCDYLTGFRIDNRSASWVLSSPVFAPYVSGNTVDGTTMPGHIVITGVFTVDVPITFFNCNNIDIGANTPIIINPIQVLTFDSSKTEVKCDTMWDGIYIQGTSARLFIKRHSVIQQARNAVVSVNGGYYSIENSKLKNNYKDIVVKAYSGVNPSVIRNTNLVMSGTFLPAYPPLPPLVTKTAVGIEIADNGGITIGDASNAVYQNVFDNIHVGIHTSNSITTVVNSKFNNIGQSVAVPFSGTAIRADATKSPYYQPSITVGGATNIQRCIFNSVQIGLDAFQNLNVVMQNNNINDVRLYGVRIQQCPLRTINVLSNFVNNNSGGHTFNTGISVLECYNAIANINGNKIFQNPTTNATQVGTGIRVALVSPGTVYLNIANNVSINRCRTGIWLQNLTGKNTAFVTSNTINFQKPTAAYTSVHYGIRLEGCATIRLDTNVVQKSTPAPTSSDGFLATNLRGISIENSPGTVATDNIFVRLGSGLYGYGISSNSTLACNKMQKCYDGVLLTGPASNANGCDIGDQIIDPANSPAGTGNIWVNSVNKDVFGKANPSIIWRDTPSPTNLTTGIIYNPGSSVCGQFFAPIAPPVSRDQQVGSVIRSAAQDSLSSEARYMKRKHAYRKLNQNPAWLYLNTPDDSMYQNFYSAYSSNGIGTVRQVELSADTGNSQTVADLAASLSCANLIEHNLKTVYGIYAATWMQEQFAFTPADSATLLSIAMQNPLDGGNAVYSARVLLDLNVDYSGNNSSQRIGNSQPEFIEAAQEIRVYPNPARDEVKLEVTIPGGKMATAQIYDLNGRLILTKPLSPQQQVYTIAVGEMEAGVYLLRIAVDGEAIITERLVIIK